MRWTPEPLGKLAPYSAPTPTQHYAAYPPSLPDWCIRATCPERVCAECGAPWAPVMETHSTSARQGEGYMEEKVVIGGYGAIRRGHGTYGRRRR